MNFNRILGVTAVAALIISFSCGQEELQFNGKPISFEQVGYFKGSNNLRYFTFNMRTEGNIDRNNIPKELLELTKKHGSKQMNTPGEITASFYYYGETQAPDITNLSAEEANSKAHEMKPVIAVWIMPNGQIHQLENPE